MPTDKRHSFCRVKEARVSDSSISKNYCLPHAERKGALTHRLQPCRTFSPVKTIESVTLLSTKAFFIVSHFTTARESAARLQSKAVSSTSHASLLKLQAASHHKVLCLGTCPTLPITACAPSNKPGFRTETSSRLHRPMQNPDRFRSDSIKNNFCCLTAVAVQICNLRPSPV